MDLPHKSLFFLLFLCLLFPYQFAFSQGLFLPLSSQAVSPQEEEQIATWQNQHPQGTAQSFVRIDWEYLGQPVHNQSDFLFDTFEGTTFTIHPQNLEYRGEDDFTWSATADGASGSSLLFVKTGGSAMGSIQLGQQKIEIIQLSTDLFVLRQAPITPKDWSCPLQGPNSLNKKSLASPNPKPQLNTKDDGTVIDVMFLFTPKAIASAKVSFPNFSPDTIAQYAIAKINADMNNSVIDLKFRKVYVGITEQEETGSYNTDLNLLVGPNDGSFDEAHSLRNRYGADIVVLGVSDLDAYGAGTLNLNPPDPQRAFLVGKWNILGTQIFSHEVGHILGLVHDVYLSPGSGAYSYGHGYVDLENRFVTIMGYHDQCSVNNISCLQLDYFSAAPSSKITYGGAPIGNATTANARQAIIDIKREIARFRDSVDNPAGADPGEKKGCFIASAAFGSFLHPKLVYFRSFRDKVLMKGPLGRHLVKLYYRHSPPMAKIIQNNETLRIATRFSLLPIAFALEYPFGVSLLLIVTLAFVLRRAFEK